MEELVGNRTQGGAESRDLTHRADDDDAGLALGGRLDQRVDRAQTNDERLDGEFGIDLAGLVGGGADEVLGESSQLILVVRGLAPIGFGS